MDRILPSRELIRQLLDYDPISGNLIWKIARSNRIFVGKIAGDKYGTIKINNRTFEIAQIVWLWNYGHPVPNTIDHIDNNRCNNRLNNYRPATRSQNMANSKLPTRNKSGVKGVRWDNKKRKWKAQITINMRQYHLGSFDTLEEATKARQVAFEKLFGEFARHK